MIKGQPQVDVIVEARMTSTRLPGKVLLPGFDKPMLHHMIERLSWIPDVSNIIIATTVNRSDDCIVKLADQLNVCCFRGDEDDVLGRVVKAAQQFKTDIIVEITGDNPLLDPIISHEVIKFIIQNESNVDFVTNDLIFTYPIGFNTRAFSRKLLESVEEKTNHPVDREHVINYICKHQEEFKIINIEAQGVYRRPDIRLTLDTREDYQVIKTIFDSLYPKNPKFNALDVISFLDSHPDLLNLNKSVVQRTYEY